MKKDQTEKELKKICDAIAIMSWSEISELGINAQQALKIKRGEKVRFHAKTFTRLKTALLGA